MQRKYPQTVITLEGIARFRNALRIGDRIKIPFFERKATRYIQGESLLYNRYSEICTITALYRYHCLVTHDGKWSESVSYIDIILGSRGISLVRADSKKMNLFRQLSAKERELKQLVFSGADSYRDELKTLSKQLDALYRQVDLTYRISDVEITEKASERVIFNRGYRR